MALRDQVAARLIEAQEIGKILASKFEPRLLEIEKMLRAIQDEVKALDSKVERLLKEKSAGPQ